MPWHLYEPEGLTLREILAVMDAYDARVLQHFNLNTRILAWYSLAPHVERGKLPSFESFLNTDEQKIDEDLATRAKYMREMLKKNGYLKN